MPLYEDSGQSPERRREEAEKLLGQVIDHIDEMTEKEQGFVRDTSQRFENYGERTVISVRQLFWLRDLAEKY